MKGKYILHTGMTHCYDDQGRVIDCHATAQDAAVGAGMPWPTPRFESGGKELVRDRLTGLVWIRDCALTDFPLDWEEALALIDTMNAEQRCGRVDWRLPNRREMRSLIDHGMSRPALPRPNPFHGVSLGWYWTSTTAARNADYAWYVHLEGGRMFYGRKTEPCWIWPVAGTSPVLPETGEKDCGDTAGGQETAARIGRDGCIRSGIEWPEPRFSVRTDAVVDRLTGLSWHPGLLSGEPKSWSEALGAVHSLAQETGKSWRMPTINELESLVDASRHDPALPADHPFRIPRDGYWSSTTSGFAPDWAYVLYLDKGAVGVGFKRNRDFYLWPLIDDREGRLCPG